MPVDSRHPDYNDRIEEWERQRHCSRGESAVKVQGELYLPMPSGFRLQADDGRAMYSAYQTRAQFPDILSPTLRGMVGIIHRVEAQIEGLEETGLEELWERATLDGLSLEAFHRRITGEILLMGRYSILVDAKGTGSLPYLSGYAPENLINWSTDRDFFVLDESGRELFDFEWRDVKRYRVLRFRNGRYTQEIYDNFGNRQGTEIEPRARGDRALTEIPFVVVGPRDLAVQPDDPPLMGVAKSSLAIYRLDADYRHQLFNSGQETLVVINGDAPKGIGAGAVISLKGDVGVTMDAKYIGPQGTGIEAHRVAILDEREAAVSAGAKVFDTQKRSAESGEALRLRYAAQTATLTTVSQASSQALEKSLRFAAQMMGRDPNLIVVKPNLDFVDSAMTAAEAKELVAVWQSGAISKRTLYENLQKGEIASAERSFEDEEELIQDEAPALADLRVDVQVPEEIDATQERPVP